MDAGDTFQGRDQTVRVVQIALDHLDFGRERGPRRIPGEGADSMTAGEKLGDDLTPNGSGGAGDKNPLRLRLRLCLGMCLGLGLGHDTTAGSLAVSFRPQGGARTA